MPSNWTKQPSFITSKYINDGTGDATIGGALTTVPANVGGTQGDQTIPGDRLIFGPADALAMSNNSVGNLYGGLFQYVTTINNSTSAPLRGHGVFMFQSNFSNSTQDQSYTVTSDEPANLTVTLFVGVLINNVTKGNSWWVQTAGKVAAKFRNAISANAAIGGGVYLAAAGNNANALDVGAFDQASNNAANQTYFQIAIDQALTRYVGVAEQLPSNNNISLIDLDLRRVRW